MRTLERLRHYLPSRPADGAGLAPTPCEPATLNMPCRPRSSTYFSIRDSSTGPCSVSSRSSNSPRSWLRESETLCLAAVILEAYQRGNRGATRGGPASRRSGGENRFRRHPPGRRPDSAALMRPVPSAPRYRTTVPKPLPGWQWPPPEPGFRLRSKGWFASQGAGVRTRAQPSVGVAVRLANRWPLAVPGLLPASSQGHSPLPAQFPCERRGFL